MSLRSCDSYLELNYDPPIPILFPVPPSKRSISRSRLLIFILHLTFEISHIAHLASILSLIPHTAKSMLEPSASSAAL